MCKIKALIVVDHQNPTTAPIALSHQGSLSTHILKPDSQSFPNTAYNEYFCLTLAKEIGLNVANVVFRKIGSVPCVIIERYPRITAIISSSTEHVISTPLITQDHSCFARGSDFSPLSNKD